MRAITCSQCGAIIKGISDGKEFVCCTYCSAEIRLRAETPVEPSELTRYQQYLKKREELSQKHPAPYAPVNDDIDRSATVKVVGLVTLVIGAIVGIALWSKSPPPKPVVGAQTPNMTPAPPFNFKFTESPTPMPEISFRTYVKYTTNIGAEHLEHPTLEAGELPTLDKKELQKTVFAQKRIQVRVTINENGEVTDAKALNGHAVLQESSIRAARKCLFSERKKETQTVLTFIFVLE